MAGHSKFKNIMHRKGAQDKKRGKLFTKLTREIIAACASGDPDPATNPALRLAVQKAKKENLPNDKIDAAIKRASSAKDGENFEPMRYEGYGPGGVAVIVEALTDNRNRTASDIRAIFGKYGGNMGETGSVSFMFENVGLITYAAESLPEDKAMDAAIEAGADNCESEEEQHHITCATDQFAQVKEALEQTLGEAETAEMTWLPQTMADIDADKAETLMKLIDALEDNDDVQKVITNASA